MNAKKELAEALVVASLAKLVKLGKVKPEHVNGKWYIEFNEEKLRGLDSDVWIQSLEGARIQIFAS